MIRITMVGAALAMLAAIQPAQAEDKDKPRAAALQKVFDCGAIGAGEERLACYDAQVAALKAAEQKKDVVVVDREQVREARRGLFGFTLPSLKIFGGGGEDKQEEELKEIETTLAGAGKRRDGAWSFTLADGARWFQIDSNIVARGPRPGSKIRIRRGALGSYFASIDGQPGIRVKREN